MGALLEKSWKLDEICALKGGVGPWMQQLDAQLAEMEKAYLHFQKQEFLEALEITASVSLWIQEGFAFISCLMVEDPHFTQIGALQSSVLQLESTYERLVRQCDSYCAAIPDEAFKKIIEEPKNQEIAYFLRHRKEVARSRLGHDKEAMLWDLARFCYFPLQKMYTQMEGAYLFQSYDQSRIWNIHQAREVWKREEKLKRSEVFEAVQSGLKGYKEIMAQLLNQVVGFRKSLSRLRGWKGPIREGIDGYRVDEKLLSGFIEGIDSMKAPLILFLKHQAQLQNQRKLSWQDLFFQIPPSSETKIAWKEGKLWIHAGLSRACSELGEFFTTIERNGHVRLSSDYMDERELPSFGVSFPRHQQHRLYINDTEQVQNLLVSTGHICQLWRKELQFSSHPINQTPFAIISAALTSLCERFVLEVIRERAQTRQHYFEALYYHIHHHAHSLLDARKKVHFDQQLYQDRNHDHFFSSEQLDKMMEKSERDTYASQLSQYFPSNWMIEPTLYDHHWACSHWGKGAGMLLGMGLYQQYLAKPKGFAEKLKEFASISGQEQRIDTRIDAIFSIKTGEKEFWSSALKSLEVDIQEMEKLVRIKDKTFNIESKALD